MRRSASGIRISLIYSPACCSNLAKSDEGGKKRPAQCAGLLIHEREDELLLLLTFFFLLFLGFYGGAFYIRTAVVGVEQNLLQFADQRVARVGAGALVVEGFNRQGINLGQELLFRYACFTNGHRDVQFLLQAVQPGQQLLDLGRGAVTGSSQTQVVSYFGITTTSLRTVVLRERSLLGRVVVGVVADHVADQQGISQTVRDVELGTQLVSHGVAHAQEGVGERDTSDGRGVVNLLTSNHVGLAVLVARRQVVLQQLQRLQSLTVRVLVSQHRHVSFHGVSHGINTTERTQGLRHVGNQVGVNDGHVRSQFVVSQRVLNASGIVSYYGEWSNF